MAIFAEKKYHRKGKQRNAVRREGPKETSMNYWHKAQGDTSDNNTSRAQHEHSQLRREKQNVKMSKERVPVST